MNRANARDRVRYYLDDADAVLATDDQVNDALQTAQEETWQVVVNSGSTLARREEEISAASGAADLATLLTYKPARVITVAEKRSADTRLTVLAARPTDAMTKYNNAVTLFVNYVPRVDDITNDTDPFVCGDADAPSRVLDDLMCIRAAQALKIAEGEVNAALERRAVDLQRLAADQLNIPNVHAMPLSARRLRTKSRFRYVMSNPYTLQLVY